MNLRHAAALALVCGYLVAVPAFAQQPHATATAHTRIHGHLGEIRVGKEVVLFDTPKCGKALRMAIQERHEDPRYPPDSDFCRQQMKKAMAEVAEPKSKKPGLKFVYLMIPPLVKNSYKPPQAALPLSHWWQYRAFDSAQECEKTQTALNSRFAKNAKKDSARKEYWVGMTTVMAEGLCIKSDDPRLKGK